MFLIRSVAKLRTSRGFDFFSGEVINTFCKMTHLGLEKVISNAAVAKEVK